jgi:hypothetical protein
MYSNPLICTMLGVRGPLSPRSQTAKCGDTALPREIASSLTLLETPPGHSHRPMARGPTEAPANVTVVNHEGMVLFQRQVRHTGAVLSAAEQDIRTLEPSRSQVALSVGKNLNSLCADLLEKNFDVSSIRRLNHAGYPNHGHIRARKSAIVADVSNTRSR